MGSQNKRATPHTTFSDGCYHAKVSLKALLLTSSNKLKQLAVPEYLEAAITEVIRTSFSELDLFRGLKSQHQQQRFFF